MSEGGEGITPTEVQSQEKPQANDTAREAFIQKDKPKADKLVAKRWERTKQRIDNIKKDLKTLASKDDEPHSEGIVAKKGELSGIELANFNRNLGGKNPEFKPKPETGLPQEQEYYDSPKLEQELQTTETITDPKTGQKITVMKLNWEAFDPDNKDAAARPIVFLTQYNNGVLNGPENNRLRELARLTGRPVIGLNYPGMQSEDLTQEQKDALDSGEGYAKVAAAQLRAMKEQGMTDIDITGASMGAWAAAALAAEASDIKINVHGLHLVEPPGVVKVKPLELAKRMGAADLDLAQSAPYDPDTRKAGGWDKPLKRLLSIAGFVTSAPKNDKMFRYAKSMAQEPIATSLDKAMATNANLQITIETGSESKISPIHGVNQLVNHLRGNNDGASRVSQIIEPGGDHASFENGKIYADKVVNALRKLKVPDKVEAS